MLKHMITLRHRHRPMPFYLFKRLETKREPRKHLDGESRERVDAFSH